MAALCGSTRTEVGRKRVDQERLWVSLVPVLAMTMKREGVTCMAEDQEVFEKVRGIIAEQLGVDPAEVKEDASFVDDLGADSLDVVELVMAFEEAFDLDIPDEDAEKIAKVKDAVSYIRERTEKA